MSSTYTDKNNLFAVYEKTFPIGKSTPNRDAIGFSQIAFLITVLPKDGPYRFRSRGTTGSSILDKI